MLPYYYPFGFYPYALIHVKPVFGYNSPYYKIMFNLTGGSVTKNSVPSTEAIYWARSVESI